MYLPSPRLWLCSTFFVSKPASAWALWRRLKGLGGSFATRSTDIATHIIVWQPVVVCRGARATRGGVSAVSCGFAWVSAIAIAWAGFRVSTSAAVLQVYAEPVGICGEA
jgi:hypothetical protein